MKTAISRFQIHDELTAPEGSVPVLRGALATGGQLPNFLGVLAGSPAALRGYARFRSELRHGKLTLATLERIALGVAEYYNSEPGIAIHSRAARNAGLAIDEVAQARQFNSKDEREAAELVGRRWTGAILRVLMDGPLRFSQVAQAVPELSDRLLSERMKQLEARGIVERRVHPGPPLRVEYELSRMGRELEPALSELQRWAERWLTPRATAGV